MIAPSASCESFTHGEHGAHLHRRRFPASGHPQFGTEEVMRKMLQKLMKDESGASLIEYVLIAGLISIVGFATMQLIGGDLGGILTTTRNATNTANGG
jgi:pilus assembly protein Flp/PilA